MDGQLGDERYKDRQGRALYKWKIDKPGIKQSEDQFRTEMAKNAVQFLELLNSVGTADVDIERDRVGAKMTEDCEQFV